MQKIGLFYSFNTKNTSKAATLIMETLGSDAVEANNIEETTEKQFDGYSHYIIGVPTWFDGELPNYWDEFIPAMEDMDFSGKKFALYGAGNQKDYPENFVDAIGIMAELLESLGGELVGFVPNEGYKFEGSKALRGDHFMGLPLDFETQPKLVQPRIEKWIEQLKTEFK